MLARALGAGTAVLVFTAAALAQTTVREPATGSSGAWRAAGAEAGQPAGQAPSAPAAEAGSAGAGAVQGTAAARAPAARVSAGSGTLPNEAGQIWREYDISPYTLRVTTTARPEQAIVDWILRETGYEPWHSEPLGILSATPRTLRVYHTPQMQAAVAEIVDRFVTSEAQTRAFGLRVITVDHPNWRAKSRQVLRPVPVQSPGVQAWILQREDAALLLAELGRRADYREHNPRHLLVPNGQSTVVAAMRAKSYVRDVVLRPDTLQGYEQDVAQLDEGFSLEFSPLVSLDGQMIDATIKCNIDQVEKLVPVVVDVPTPTSPRQRTQVEVPQMTHFRFHERFRWPENHVLVIGMGVVAVPVGGEGQTLVPGLPIKLPGGGAPRGELIVVVESRGKLGAPGARAATAQREARTYEGRY